MNKGKTLFVKEQKTRRKQDNGKLQENRESFRRMARSKQVLIEHQTEEKPRTSGRGFLSPNPLNLPLCTNKKVKMSSGLPWLCQGIRSMS